MDVVRTRCKLLRIHHAYTALSLRPHYVHATSLALSPRPYPASITFIQSPRRLHCVLLTSLRFLTRSYPVRSRFLLRPPRLIESFNHSQIKTLIIVPGTSSCCKNKILPHHEKTGSLHMRSQKRRLAAQ